MRSTLVLALLSILGLTPAVAPCASADDGAIGRTAASLLAFARERNPEYAAMRSEADAARERAMAAGSLADPKFRMELRDITRSGEQNATLSPSGVGSTRYLLSQDLPWFGKRDLQREIAELEAEGATGKARGSWSDIAARIKVAHAQRHYLYRNERLTRELLDLSLRLERVAQARYAGGLAAQQDVIRAQVEQTDLRSELLQLENESRQLNARLNALLARPATAELAAPAELPPLPAAARLDPATLAERVRARNPLLFSEETRVQAAEKSRALAYRNRYPDFTVGFGPIQYQNSVKEWEVMIELNIPLQQSARRAQERESEAMLSAARSRQEAAANQVLAELTENLAGIEAARRIETLTTGTLLPQAELSFRSALAGYETGKVDFVTLLEAQRQMRQARQRQIKAQSEAQVRLAEIERLLGEDL
ncbi:TolC family protein [Accumulibacter sp.]|uniref:TolC family protein n=1 Tax=Accumulibacter sp. TaxID=2053492 RepID=UPI0035B1451C